MSKLIDNETLQSLICRIYDAALDDTLWQALLNDTASFIGATECNFFSPRIKPDDQPFFLASFKNLSLDSWLAYENYYWQHDIWAELVKNRDLMKKGAIVFSNELISSQLFRRSEIYNEFFKPELSNIDTLIGLSVFDDTTPDDSPTMNLNFYRPAYSEPFDHQSAALIKQLEPHIQRALRIRWKLQTEQRAKELCEQALNRLNTSILILNGLGQIVFANPLAETILQQGGNPTMRNGCLGGLSVSDCNAIQNAIQLAANGLGTTLRLHNPPPLGVRVATFAPLNPDMQLYFGRARVLVMLSESDKAAPHNIERFAKLYRLTAAETRVFQELLQQKTPKEIAEHFQVSIKTLRSQLSSLFAKTQTKNQRELVLFYLSHPNIS